MRVRRNLTLDQYLDLLLNLHDLYDKTVNMHKGIIDNLSSRLEAAESELDAIKNEWRIGSQDELQRISAI